MPDTWATTVRIGDLGVDAAAGQFVLVTNGVCVLCQAAAAHYQDCSYRPYEGLVFQVVDGVLVGWALERVVQRDLLPAEGELAGSVLWQFRDRLAVLRKNCNAPWPRGEQRATT